MAARIRVMLSMLGLGLEQTTTWLAQARPSPGEFRHWIVQVAGMPRPEVLERYLALVCDRPMPAAAKHHIDAIDRMPPVLDEGELGRWERDGYAVLQDAMAPVDVLALAHLAWKVAEARPDEPETWYAARPQGIMLQHFQSPQQDAARYSARIHKAFAQLWGTADLWPSIDRLGFSPPVTPAAPFRASPLHWDCSLHRPVPYGMFGVLYLADTGAEQGLFVWFQDFITAWIAGWKTSGSRIRAWSISRMRRSRFRAEREISSSAAMICRMEPVPIAEEVLVWCNISRCFPPGTNSRTSGARVRLRSRQSALNKTSITELSF